MAFLTKEKALDNATKNAISAARRVFYRFHESMEGLGFGLNRQSYILKENEAVWERGIDPKTGLANGASNFAVFAKYMKGGWQVAFFNPDFSEGAGMLSASQIHKLYFLSSLRPGHADEILEGVKKASGNKPENVFFLDTHDHLGNIPVWNGPERRWEIWIDLFGGNLDDGKSGLDTVLRQRKFYGKDIRFSGCHNGIYRDISEFTREMEGTLAISSGYGLELTMPLRQGDMNGPHQSLWFDTLETALAYHSEILAERTGKYVAYAPNASFEKISEMNQKLRKEGKLAVGLNHPLTLGNSVMPVPSVGVLDVVARGDRLLGWALDYAGEYADGVELFNQSLPKASEVRFFNPSEEERIRGMMKKYGLGSKLTANAGNLAYGYCARENFGKFLYSGNDIHLFRPLKYDLHVHGLGKSWTVIRGLMGTGRKKPAASEVVALMRSKDASEKIIPFVPLAKHGGVVWLPKARENDTPMQRLLDGVEQAVFYLKTLPVVLGDAWRQAKKPFR